MPTCVVKLLLGRYCTTINERLWQSRHRHIRVLVKRREHLALVYRPTPLQ